MIASGLESQQDLWRHTYKFGRKAFVRKLIKVELTAAKQSLQCFKDRYLAYKNGLNT